MCKIEAKDKNILIGDFVLFMSIYHIVHCLNILPFYLGFRERYKRAIVMNK